MGARPGEALIGSWEAALPPVAQPELHLEPAPTQPLPGALRRTSVSGAAEAGGGPWAVQRGARPSPETPSLRP